MSIHHLSYPSTPAYALPRVWASGRVNAVNAVVAVNPKQRITVETTFEIMDNIFRHKPVSSPKNFRLLLLHPSPELDDPIHCSVREITMDGQHRHPYEALSYVWGAPTGDQEIICHGKTLMITANCLAALRHLRLRTRDRPLWVDSISIDQESIPERNQQIKLMGDIYKNAERVLIWMGEGNHDTTKLFRRLRWAGAFLSLMNRSSASSSLTSRPLGMFYRYITSTCMGPPNPPSHRLIVTRPK
jgi:hypothetical protein